MTNTSGVAVAVVAAVLVGLAVGVTEQVAVGIGGRGKVTRMAFTLAESRTGTKSTLSWPSVTTAVNVRS